MLEFHLLLLARPDTELVLNLGYLQAVCLAGASEHAKTGQSAYHPITVHRAYKGFPSRSR